MTNQFIYGSDPTLGIVSLEVTPETLTIFTENETINREGKYYWLASPKPSNSPNWYSLEGDLHYRYIKLFGSEREFQSERNKLYGQDTFNLYDAKEMAMTLKGLTYYKGLKISDVSKLAFDIESTTLRHTDDAKVLLITNTLSRKGTIERKMFAYTDYGSEREMIDAWCQWVRDVNPSIIMGHNIYGYDLPYLDFCARRADTRLRLGRGGEPIKFESYTSRFRKDGNQFLKYHRASIFGREIIDTMFLAMKYDVSRKYENYTLKGIVAQEQLEVQGRQFYDAQLIRTNYTNPTEWKKIKAYAIHDADDALNLFELMAPSYFYLCQSIPKSFQNMITSASGSQINSFLVRSYLQESHSLPKASPGVEFEGAISIGNPGLYGDVFKVDVASLYPSIMLEHRIHDSTKDPKGNFLRMVEHFTHERLENKRLAKETGDRYYKDLEQAQKIVINSAYGMMAATGLIFNSPKNAPLVTRLGREILSKAISWAITNGYQIVNADTDSISIIGVTEPTEALVALNALFPSSIRWEHDGFYKRVLVLKAKNYVLDDGKKIKIKGSALKATPKEPALKEFIQRTLTALLDGDNERVMQLYNDYAKEIHNLSDIRRWASKKTITESVLNSERTTEEKIRTALNGEDFELGDKIYVYFDTNDNLKLSSKWSGDHNKERLLDKLHSTLEIFEPILNISSIPNYKLKRNKPLLKQLLIA